MPEAEPPTQPVTAVSAYEGAEPETVAPTEVFPLLPPEPAAESPSLDEVFEHTRTLDSAPGRARRDGRPIIELVDVRKVYSAGSLSVEALRGVSLTIEEGEFVAIIGPSGSGKSTLMHILGCLDTPTSGSFHLSGQDVSHMSETELAHIRNQRIGFVFQGFHLLSTMSAWRNVELPLAYASVPRAERRERAIAALRRVGLGERVEHRPGELSGGQQQRVAVARALVTDPDVVLADEPTGNLDTASTEEILGLFSDLHRAGRTVVLITHEPEVAAVASRVIRVRDGQVTEAPPRELSRV
ncbi:MAG TPA: ABC transporter ATP-binding protein [Acidimicrobiales bacterium]|nr:ABC transporter ATP-binding protein [Acidimicrobiales bacterium]